MTHVALCCVAGGGIRACGPVGREEPLVAPLVLVGFPSAFPLVVLLVFDHRISG